MSTDRTPLDRLRDRAEGRLDPAEAQAMDAEIARDPELRAIAAAFAPVHAATGPADASAETPSSRLGWTDLDLPEGGGAARRWVLAAAALLVLGVGLGFLFRSSGDEPAVVELASVPLAVAPPTPPAALLASWRPVANGGLRWIASLEEGRAIARFTHRPVLVYGMYPGCPMCREMERGTLSDAAVAAAAGRFVPVRLDASRLTEDEARRLLEEGWPYIVVESPEGERLQKLSGMYEAPAFRERLEAAWTARPEPLREPVEWDRAEQAAQRDAQAGEARDALLVARDLAGTDRAAAETRLGDAATRLAGTPFAADLSRVLDRLRGDGRFPELKESPR